MLNLDISYYDKPRLTDSQIIMIKLVIGKQIVKKLARRSVFLQLSTISDNLKEY